MNIHYVMVFSVSHSVMTNLLQSLSTSSITDPSALRWNLWRSGSRSLLVAILTTLGVCGGLAPDVSNFSARSWQQAPAYAQSAISNSEVARFARAAYKIERERQALYALAKPIYGGAVPANLCGTGNVPSALAAPCQAFLVNSDRHIRESGLPAPRFYEIYNRQQSDPDLQARVNKELQLCQQQGACR